MRTFDDDELIRRVTDVEEIKKLANRRVYYQINEWREKELSDLWVSGSAARKTASLGANPGYYVGMDAIRAHYVDDRKKEIGDGTGFCCAHPISTGLVELAGDGRTAKGLWYCIGQETAPNGDGTAKALWETGKVAIDFVKEGESWKIWHVMEASDCVCEAGSEYSEGSPYVDFATDPVAAAFGAPTVPMLTHDQNFNWWDNYPAPPKPYETWSDDISYGPEGYPKAEVFAFRGKEGGNYQ